MQERAKAVAKAYYAIVKIIIRAVVEWCHERGRVVHYVHTLPGKQFTFNIEGEQVTLSEERIYLTRYCLWGHMSGESRGDELKKWQWAKAYNSTDLVPWRERLLALAQWVRSHLPNVYLHCIQYPDIDASVHNHPWPWGFAVGLMGAYEEERLEHDGPLLPEDWKEAQIYTTARTHRAPFFNWISGKAFHRIASLHEIHSLATPYMRLNRNPSADPPGVWTLFVAGPRAHSKPWGYLVSGRGFAPQEERHAEIGASELVEPRRAHGKYLSALGDLYGVARKRWLWVFHESDKSYRKRIATAFKSHWRAYDEREAQADSGDRITLESVPVRADGEPS